MDFRLVIYRYIDRGHLYECNGVKIIMLCALDIEIINIHVLTRHSGRICRVLHMKCHRFLLYNS
jgi:hypothetical protein